jgi:hypothetical protein
MEVEVEMEMEMELALFFNLVWPELANQPLGTGKVSGLPGL